MKEIKCFFMCLILTIMYSAVYLYSGYMITTFIRNEQYIEMMFLGILFITHFVLTILYFRKNNIEVPRR